MDALAKPAEQSRHNQVVRLLQNLYDVTVHDFMGENMRTTLLRHEAISNRRGPWFVGVPTQPAVAYPPTDEPSVQANAKRLHALLTLPNSAKGNLVSGEAKRRIKFFTNSLFMKMPDAPPAR